MILDFNVQNIFREVSLGKKLQLFNNCVYKHMLSLMSLFSVSRYF